MARADTITRSIKTTKRRLLAGGLLRPVEWGKPGEPDVRGRRIFTYTMLDVLIEERPALDHGRLSTERSDEIKLIVLDALAISDSDLFRWGEPVHVYSIKAIDGLLQDEQTGVRFSSELTLIR